MSPPCATTHPPSTLLLLPLPSILNKMKRGGVCRSRVGASRLKTAWIQGGAGRCASKKKRKKKEMTVVSVVVALAQSVCHRQAHHEISQSVCQIPWWGEWHARVQLWLSLRVCQFVRHGWFHPLRAARSQTTPLLYLKIYPDVHPAECWSSVMGNCRMRWFCSK